MASQVGFQIWDAPSSGDLLLDMTEAAKEGDAIVSVTLIRSSGADATVKLRISSFAPGTDWDLKSIAHSVLLSHVERLASEAGVSVRDAAEQLMLMTHATPGRPQPICIDGREVEGWLYVVPATSDWVVVAKNDHYAVGVAGVAGVDLPALTGMETGLLDDVFPNWL